MRLYEMRKPHDTKGTTRLKTPGGPPSYRLFDFEESCREWSISQCLSREAYWPIMPDWDEMRIAVL